MRCRGRSGLSKRGATPRRVKWESRRVKDQWIYDTNIDIEKKGYVKRGSDHTSVMRNVRRNRSQKQDRKSWPMVLRIGNKAAKRLYKRTKLAFRQPRRQTHIIEEETAA